MKHLNRYHLLVAYGATVVAVASMKAQAGGQSVATVKVLDAYTEEPISGRAVHMVQAYGLERPSFEEIMALMTSGKQATEVSNRDGIASFSRAAFTGMYWVLDEGGFGFAFSGEELVTIAVRDNTPMAVLAADHDGPVDGLAVALLGSRSYDTGIVAETGPDGRAVLGNVRAAIAYSPAQEWKLLPLAAVDAQYAVVLNASQKLPSQVAMSMPSTAALKVLIRDGAGRSIDNEVPLFVRVNDELFGPAYYSGFDKTYRSGRSM